MPSLFHHTLTLSAERSPQAIALRFKDQSLSYAALNQQVMSMAAQINALGLATDARVAVYLPKQFETVISFYASSLAGNIFVPVNPLLKAAQVDYILQHCEVSFLVTSLSRFRQLEPHLQSLPALKQVILTDCTDEQVNQLDIQPTKKAKLYCWQTLVNQTAETSFPEREKGDLAAILYTSGSTGNPKGVMLSHDNLVIGARSVTEYLQNSADDKLLAVLPFSFDYGLSQLSTAFLTGAQVVLFEFLFAKDVIKAIAKYQITGLAAVPPLWVQLAALDWPSEAIQSLRYITNSGGAMPQAALRQLRRKLVSTQIFLMYGLTEAFRSSYLPPEQLEARPTSMGKAIPYADILLVNGDGNDCAPGEHGELVHRGPLVAQGYWNDPQKTARRFKPLPHFVSDANDKEVAVWSGDTVRRDEQGYLYFVGRQDDMIKSSGYRISPSEIEDCVYQHPSVSEVAAIGVNHHQLGQAVVLIIKPVSKADFDQSALIKHCQLNLANFMQPKSIQVVDALARNPNGKINRPLLADQFKDLFAAN